MPAAFLHAPAATQYTGMNAWLECLIFNTDRQLVRVPTSFWVTVSMMVPKAGMVDILTELEAARKQSFTIHSQMSLQTFY